MNQKLRIGLVVVESILFVLMIVLTNDRFRAPNFVLRSIVAVMLIIAILSQVFNKKNSANKSN